MPYLFSDSNRSETVMTGWSILCCPQSVPVQSPAIWVGCKEVNIVCIFPDDWFRICRICVNLWIKKRDKLTIKNVYRFQREVICLQTISRFKMSNALYVYQKHQFILLLQILFILTMKRIFFNKKKHYCPTLMMSISSNNMTVHDSILKGNLHFWKSNLLLTQHT